jgi:3'-phosphoadenosine 5'-phosphosulfate sulfotransferase (PAPS reductase)/FAD synthetase
MKRVSRPEAFVQIDQAPPVAGDIPDLASYDCILLSSSSGKDSQTMLDYVVEVCQVVGLAHGDIDLLTRRIVVVHADLGRVEWDGSKSLAQVQAECYGLRFAVVSRIGGVATRDGKAYTKGEVYGDLLDYIKRRGMWPDSCNRYCTSDFKRGPIRKLMTRLHREWKAKGNTGTFRLLNCMGMRAEESPARAKRPQLANNKAMTTKTRVVDDWLPIQHWTESQVWARIKRCGVPYHPAYELGMPRLSCVFCIFAPRGALMIAGQANPQLLADYVEIEADIDHDFRNKFKLASILEALESGEQIDYEALGGNWNM